MRRYLAIWSAGALGAAAVALAPASAALGAAAESSDAGDTLATAQVITGFEDEISGALSATDGVDVYRISITNPGAFTASTYDSAVGDTELLLFDSAGHLVELSDDWYYQGSLDRMANLPAGAYGNPYAPASAGTYYLAVVAYESDPMTSSAEDMAWGDEWTDPVTGSRVWGPVDPSYVLDHWDVITDAYSGNYTVSLTGVGALPTLYAVGAATSLGQGASNLYTVNVSTGQATLVNPITVAGTQLTGITGIDFAPDGTLYAVDNANQRLLTVNKSTGVAAVVGSFGALGGWFPDITFDKYGYLFGWSEKTPPTPPSVFDDLLRLYPDGTTAWVGESGYDTGATGLATAADGTMYVKTGTKIATVSPQTGAVTASMTTTGRTSNGADIIGSTLYTEYRPESDGSSITGSTLKAVNVHNGLVTQFANDPDVWLTGVAFDTDVTTSGTAADLRTSLSVSPTAQVIGDPVTFTVAVTNAGPSDASVTVAVPLPSGVAYSSDDSTGGAYDSGTGAWTVGPLADGANATLHVSATVNATGDLQATAIASSNVYNPGPIASTTTLTRGVVPTMTGNPLSSTVLDGASVNFMAAASGSPEPTVQWQQLTTEAGADWTDMTGKTTTTLSFTAALAMSGYQYRAVFTNTWGTATSTVATLTVRTVPVISNLAATVAKGKITLTFTPTGTPLPTTFQYFAAAKQGWVSFTGSGYSFPAKGTKEVSVRASNDGAATWSATATAAVTR
jgi:uncharacterized repeat protein (TIGR01451 family)